MMFRRCSFICSALLSLCGCTQALATDYFLTLGGGYSREANQASLEANVLFFQQVLLEEHREPRVSATFFADGYNDRADLQFLPQETVTTTPATDLLAEIFSFRGSRPPVAYRNHAVPNIAGPIEPANVHSSLSRLTKSMQAGDRLIVYVTAHGGSAKGKNKFNTSITCWNDQSIRAREFEAWLDEVPVDVPVVMVMAQCYCGGFSHTIFEESDSTKGLAKQTRVGFFAQQHDLAAAGCRPDIDNDQEYSSFFWGAFVGRSRNGVALSGVDLNRDAKVSFAEAHAHAVLASDTIDIPLRTSEALLREYSRIGGYDHRRDTDSGDVDLSTQAGLAEMAGTFEEVVASASLDQRAIVLGLVAQLGLNPQDDVYSLFEQFEKQRDESAQIRRSSYRGRRGRGRSSGRRELWVEIGEKWPELSDRESWRKAKVLEEGRQDLLLEEIRQLPSFAAFEASQSQLAEAAMAREESELKEVKFQRLINTLEAILLAKNLPVVADDEIVSKYAVMLAVEESFLSDNATKTKSN